MTDRVAWRPSCGRMLDGVHVVSRGLAMIAVGARRAVACRMNDVAAIRSACDRFLLEMARLDLRWFHGAPTAAIYSRRRDLQIWLDMLFDELPHGVNDDDDRMLVHDVFMQVIAFARLLEIAVEDLWADPRHVRVAKGALDELLDAMLRVLAGNAKRRDDAQLEDSR